MNLEKGQWNRIVEMKFFLRVFFFLVLKSEQVLANNESKFKKRQWRKDHYVPKWSGTNDRVSMEIY